MNNNRMAKLETLDQSDELVLKSLAAASFLIFFSGYIVAPLIPTLAQQFRATQYQLGWVVPAYLIPYGVSTIFYGPLSDRFGRKNMFLLLLGISVVMNLISAMAWSVHSFIAIRFLAGLGSGGVVTVALALVGDMYPYEKLGRPMGWMFGAIAGGMAFGSTLGAWLNPYIGWRNEFIIVAIASALVLAFLIRKRDHIRNSAKISTSVGDLISGYASLLKDARGARTFFFIFMNGIFHGGIFAWLGSYLFQRYGLSDVGIGQALLGYGIPGMLLGPWLGRLADKYGRRRIIPLGFLVAASCALSLIPKFPLWSVTIFITSLSVGLDMSHPLLAGIVASLDPKRRGQAMGLNTFAIFIGLGTGAIIFQNLMLGGTSLALLVFGAVQFSLGLIGFRIFRSEIGGGETEK